MNLDTVQLPPVAFHPAVDFSQLMERLQNKHGYDYRDMADSNSHFGKWCDAKGYGSHDPNGNHRNSSQFWYAEYQRAPDGKAQRPPYQDVWHWFIDWPLSEFNRGGVTEMYLDELIEEADEIPDYVMRVLRDIQSEVQGHPAYDAGTLHLHIDW